MAQTSGKDAVSLRIKSILEKSQSKSAAAAPVEDDSGMSSEEENGSKCKDVRGRRLGNRFWKNDKKRFSSIVATRGLKSISFEAKEKLRRDLKHSKELTKANIQGRAQAKQEQRERRKENLKRREENARKAEIVQVIKNPAKLKRLKKKQLRSIAKRDTTGMV